MSTLPLRESARVIVLDEHDRLLLLRYNDEDHDSAVFWATPGGSLEAQEDHQQAARRELLEELGVGDVALGPQTAAPQAAHGWRAAHPPNRALLHPPRQRGRPRRRRRACHPTRPDPGPALVAPR